MRRLICILLICFSNVSLGVELFFPAPVVPENSEGVNPNDIKEVRERVQTVALTYLDAFMVEFLRVNGLSEDLFDRQLVIADAKAKINKIPSANLTNPKAMMRETINMRNSMIEYTKTLYTPEKVAKMLATGRSMKFDSQFISRFESLEKQVQELVQNRSSVPAPELQGVQQRLGSLEDIIGRLAPPQNAPLAAATPESNNNRVAMAALVLAGGSFLFQLFSRRK